MFSQIMSSALWGISSKLVHVEVDVSLGLPGFCMVGLPDAAVKESRDRVVAALKNSELDLPPRRITINLAPAHLRKEGPAYDLPIALAILAATGQLKPEALSGHLVFGELSLDGRLCPVRGALSLASAARPAKIKRIVLPAENAMEAAAIRDCEILPMKSLLEAVDYFSGKTPPELFHLDIEQFFKSSHIHNVDFSDVRGQEHAKRALAVAAAGGHNVLMIGPPGSGKSMLSQRLPSILPELTLEESLETTRIYSISSRLSPGQALINRRPFRAPHHTLSDIALIGGGSYPRPGEVSLAHHGVLFLDELPEFSKNALEVLRQPLEDGQVTISRAAAAVTFPSRFMLVAAMNPCPCGYYTDPSRECTCHPAQIHKYLGKISGPLLDRFDIHLEAPAVKYQELIGQGASETSHSIRERITATRQRQSQRYRNDPGVFVNAHLGPRLIRSYCHLGPEGHALLKAAMTRLSLSARAYHRILKVARTIADLEGEENIQPAHVGEAIQYRALDKHYWGRRPGG